MRQIRRQLEAEEGFTLVAAVAVLAVTLLLVTAAVGATVASMKTATRSRTDAQALQAAEAAADLGWNRINLVHIDSLNLNATTPCLSFDLSGNITAVAALVFGSQQWCPSVPVSVPGTSAASYQVSQLTSGSRYIVGTATVGPVTRRVELVLSQTNVGVPLFGNYAVQSEYSLDFQNGSEVLGGGVRSDGSIKLEDTQVPCHVPNGPIIPGPGQTVITTNGAGTCGQSTTPATSAISWPTITAPAVDNDSQIVANGNVLWNAATKSLTLQNGATLTLTGNTYVFCSLNLMDGTIDLKPSNGQPVQIFMLPPGGLLCSGVGAGSQSLTLQNTDAWVKNDTGLGAQGVQLYVTGATRTYLNNDSAHQFNGVIYAPNNPNPGQTPPAIAVQVINSAAVKGAIAAYSMLWTANAWLVYDSSATNVKAGGGSILYNQQQYLECPPAPGTGQAPDGGCP